MSIVIDARTGSDYEYTPEVTTAISKGILLGRTHGWSRADSVSGEIFADRSDWLQQWRRRSDALWIQEFAQKNGIRRDALVGNAGAFPRDFEFIHERVLEEKRRPLNIERLIPMDRTVPLGAKTHTWRRRLGQGEAQIYRGGSRFSRASTSRVEEQFPVVYIVCAVETNHFEMLSDSFEGRRDIEAESRLAVRLIRERINRIGFGGDAASGLSGILTHPDLAKKVAGLPYTSASSGAALVADLNLFVNFARVDSGGMFRPTRLATSIRQEQLFSQTLHSPGTSDTTLREFFLKGQGGDGIKEINGIHELRNAGPAADQDAWFAYDDDMDSTHMVMVQPPAPLPVHAIDPLRNQTLWVAAVGGVVMPDVGNNHLQFAAAA